MVCPFPRDQGREAGAAACRRPSCVCKKLGRGRLGLSLSERPGARSGSGSLPPPFLRLQKAGARAAWAVPFRETRGAKRERQLAAALLASAKSRGAGGLVCPFPRDQGREAGAAACRRPSCVCKKLRRGRLGLSPSKRPGARSGSGSLPPGPVRE